MNGKYFLISYLVFAVCVALVLGQTLVGQPLSLHGQLSNNPAFSQGQVVSFQAGDWMNSPTVSYTYPVNGQQMSGTSPVSSSKPQFTPGAMVRVLYLDKSPDVSGIDLDGLKESGQRGILLTIIVELGLALIAMPLYFLTRSIPGGTPKMSAVAPPIQYQHSSIPVDDRIVRFGRFRMTVAQARKQIFFSNVILGIVALVILSLGIPGYVKANQLVASSLTTTGLVKNIYHKQDFRGYVVEYTYTVNGVEYSGSTDYDGESASGGNVPVHYMASDPNYSSAAPELSVKSAGNTLGTEIMIFLAGTLFTVIGTITVKRASIP